MSALRNWTALKRNISNRIRQALEELQQNLRNLDRAPAPQRVPVQTGRPRLSAPQYGNVARFGSGAASRFAVSRFYSTFSSLHCGSIYCGLHTSNGHVSYSGKAYPGHLHGFNKPRFFSTYTRFNQWKWRPVSHSYSHRTQFRLKLFSTFYKTPTLTELLKKKVGTEEFNPPKRIVTAIASSMPANIRLNLLLTERFHDMVMDLARGTASGGCYVDFSLEPKLFIPSATVLHADVLAEVLANLRRFERHVADLQKDLLRLSELGELPLKYMSSEKVIRVFFPNCDRESVERLLVEKQVLGGVVHDDVAGHYAGAETSISEFDLLSSCSPSSSSGSSNSDIDDILSWSDDIHDDIVHVEPVSTLQHIDIMEDTWAY